MRELLESEDYKKILDKNNYDGVKARLDIYERIANGAPRSDEDATWLLIQQYVTENGGVYPSPDEIARIVQEARKG